MVKAEEVPGRRDAVRPRERPDSIRAYLAAGGDPTDLDAWRLLAEIVCDREADGEHQTLDYCRRWLAEIDAHGVHACGCRILVRRADLGFVLGWLGAARIGGWPASIVLSGW
jgi:hypothetical protein